MSHLGRQLLSASGLGMVTKFMVQCNSGQIFSWSFNTSLKCFISSVSFPISFFREVFSCSRDSYSRWAPAATKALSCEETSWTRERQFFSSGVCNGDMTKRHRTVILRSVKSFWKNQILSWFFGNTHCYLSEHTSTAVNCTQLSCLEVLEFLRSLFNRVFLSQTTASELS